MEYKVIPNFLPDHIFEFYTDYFFYSSIMEWRYASAIGTEADKSGFFFTRELYYKDPLYLDENVFKISTPLLYHANITTPLRIKANCFIKQPQHIFSDPHTDSEIPHKVFLYSINSNNGFTILDPKGKNIKIPSRANQALFFDGFIEHQAVTQTDEDIRVNININYI